MNHLNVLILNLGVPSIIMIISYITNILYSEFLPAVVKYA